MVANSAVVVGEGDAGAGAGHRHPGQGVALRVGALASCRDIWKTPTSVALAPHIDRPVLAQGATFKPFKLVSLLCGIEGSCIDAAVAVDGTVFVAETIPLPPVHLEGAPRTSTKVARVPLWAVLACLRRDH